MKVGVIGCGFFAQNHLAAWQAIKEVNLVAVCDQQRQLAEAAKTRFRAHQAYNEAEEMLANEAFKYCSGISSTGSIN